MKLFFLTLLRCTAIFGLSATAYAGNFGVSPIRMDLDRANKTGAITVTNNDEKLLVQMRAFEWKQDANGKDVYEESNDLIFFPKIMTLAKGESRIIRAGYKVPATEVEKTYRLFIEEIPEPNADNKPAAQVAVAIRFGVPVFLHPLKEDTRVEIDAVAFADNALLVKARNAGNQHVIINAIEIKSSKVELSHKGWYLLAGAQREHKLEVPAGFCTSSESVTVNLKTDKGDFSRKVDAVGCP